MTDIQDGNGPTRSGNSIWIEFTFDVSGVFLAALLPLVIFLKHHGYPLLAPETQGIILMVLAFAVVAGLLMIPWGTPLRFAVYTILCVMIVDVQTTWITTWGLRLLLNILFWGFLVWLVRRRVSRVMVWLAGSMVLGSLFLPSEVKVIDHGKPGPREGDRQDLPFVLHIVLDEQIGVEGIPVEFDPDGIYAGELKDGYLERSFEVYGRAYSRYASTFESIPNMLNGTSSANPGEYFGGGFREGMELRENAWLDLLRNRGYRLHFIQTKAFKFVDPGGDGWRSGDTGLEYVPHNLPAFSGESLPLSQKVPILLSSYFRLSFVLKRISGGYGRIAESSVGTWLSLPDLQLGDTRPAMLSVLNATDRFVADLDGAGPGQAWLIHLLAPHFPYAFQADCSLTDVSDWRESMDHRASPARNTLESRALRYRLFLEQMRCVQGRMMAAFDQLDRQGLWEDALVIVHGDHGSRISLQHGLPGNVDQMVASDYSDLFSTLYAVKFPQGTSRYDDRLLPLDHLFGKMILDGEDPGDADLQAHPKVFLQEGNKRLVEIPLVPFGD